MESFLKLKLKVGFFIFLSVGQKYQNVVNLTRITVNEG